MFGTLGGVCASADRPYDRLRMAPKGDLSGTVWSQRGLTLHPESIFLSVQHGESLMF